MGGKPGEMKPIMVKTITVGLDNSDKTVFSSGTTVANEEVELKSEISGIITKLNIPEGKMVAKGFLIAKIKDDDIVAQLRKIELEEKLAAQIEARQRKLLDINAISKEEFEISQNKVLTLKADKDLLKVQLAKTEIRAPFAGKIGLKNISLGAYVTPANVITSLVQFNPIKLDFTIPEKYLNSIVLGKTIKFQTDGSLDERTASIVAVDPKIDETMRTLKVRALSNNSSNTLLPGMFIKVFINLGSTQSVMIPTETVIPVVDGKKVFVKRNGKAEEIKIETGLRNASSLQVLKGLNVGDSLITSGLMTLKAGTPVFTKK
ncbi:MAG: efflux RND transporter periplasmic adaptor subunit [Cytophagaceae bacterium]|nr:efflux RND transporter periplasmic adaptor subunit [Cytophagaceae bacterium]